MQAVAQIGRIAQNKLPSIKEIEHYFLKYKEDEWASGGATGASFRIYGADGTDDKEPYAGRIDISLSITDHPTFGMYLFYFKFGGSEKERYYMVGDSGRLTEMTSSRNGDILSVGLFVPPDIAWLAVKDFILSNGARSPDVKKP